MLDVMLDLETMSTGPDAAIVAIGAVEFDPEAGIGTSFYMSVDLLSSVAGGGQMDASTVLWWLQRDAAVRAAIVHGRPLPLVLESFSRWLARCGPVAQVRLWGNGAGFDNVILRRTYTRLDAEPPWTHWNDRCYRTLKEMRPDIPMQRQGMHHHAHDDARSQAEHALRLLAAMQLPAAPSAASAASATSSTTSTAG